MADVVLNGVRKSFGSAQVILGIDLEIRDGEFVVFVGPSGCGKSTLLRVIAGLEDITSGDLLIDGVLVNDVPPAKRGVAMVFQSYALYPHMSAYENMAFGLQLAKASRREIDARVRRVAALLQIEPLLERKPRQLSGGQRQRVAIGRAIVREPKVFLFDEPLSNLDAALRVQTRIEIAKLHSDTRATMIYVTHDQVEAMTLADRIVVLNGGRVEQVGTPLDLYRRPANRFVAGFIGSPQMNFVDGEIARPGRDGVLFRLPNGRTILIPVVPDGLEPGDPAVLGIRPDHIRLDAGCETLTGRIDLVEQLGESHLIHIQAASNLRLTVRATGDTSHAAGDEVGVCIAGEFCHLFRATGESQPRLQRTPSSDGGADVPSSNRARLPRS